MSKLAKISALLLTIVFFLTISGLVLAQGRSGDDNRENGNGNGRPDFSREASESGSTESGESEFHANPRSCQAKEDAVKKRSLQLTNLATMMQNRFNTIALRVENFATSSGKTIPNYTSLVNDISVKNASVSASLTVAQNDANNFSCAGNNPKGQISQFQLDMQTVKGALKNLRTSVNNLIVAVHSVTGDQNSGENEATGSGHGGGNQ